MHHAIDCLMVIWFCSYAAGDRTGRTLRDTIKRIDVQRIREQNKPCSSAACLIVLTAFVFISRELRHTFRPGHIELIKDPAGALSSYVLEAG